MHAFIFWGFLVLLPHDRDGDDRDRSTAAPRCPWLGRQGWFALLVDVFAVLVLVGVIAAVVIRKVQRPARFEGSHLGEADLILALIAGIVITLLLLARVAIALGLNEWPARWSPVSNALSHLFGGGSGTQAPSACSRGPTCSDPRLPRLPAVLEAPAHRHRGDQRLLRPHRRPRPARAAAVRRRRGRGGDALRRRHGRRPDLEADASTRSRAPSAAAARTSARPGRRARRSRRSS